MPKPNPLYNASTEVVQKNAGKTLPSTWSDPSVNISLDNLVPGMQPSKPQQPSLNTMMQQQSKFLLHCFAQHWAMVVFSRLSLRWSILSVTVFLHFVIISYATVMVLTQVGFSKWRPMCKEACVHIYVYWRAAVSWFLGFLISWISLEYT